MFVRICGEQSSNVPFALLLAFNLPLYTMSNSSVREIFLCSFCFLRIVCVGVSGDFQENFSYHNIITSLQTFNTVHDITFTDNRHFGSPPPLAPWYRLRVVFRGIIVTIIPVLYRYVPLLQRLGVCVIHVLTPERCQATVAAMFDEFNRQQDKTKATARLDPEDSSTWMRENWPNRRGKFLTGGPTLCREAFKNRVSNEVRSVLPTNCGRHRISFVGNGGCNAASTTSTCYRTTLRCCSML